MKMKKMNEVHRSLRETSRSNVEWIWSTAVKTLQSANIEDLVAGYHTVRSLRPQLQGQWHVQLACVLTFCLSLSPGPLEGSWPLSNTFFHLRIEYEDS